MRRSESEITFLEIGADRDHVHFLVQSVPVPGAVGAGLYEVMPSEVQSVPGYTK